MAVKIDALVNGYRVMGFEQLAGLKEQLAKQAEEAKAKSKPPRAPRPARPAPRPARPVKAEPVDPVVHTIGKLQKRFPHAFPKNPSPKVPLKVGIFEDLMAVAPELALSEAELREAIKTWCRGSRYWTSLVEDAVRVNLAGDEAGRVSSVDAARARHLEKKRAARSGSKAQAAAKTPAATAARVASAARVATAKPAAPATPAAPAATATPAATPAAATAQE
jgi:ProP effector